MATYKDHAHRRTIVEYMQRNLLNQFIESDTPPKETLVCEEVFKNESEVTQDALKFIYQQLQVWESHERDEMNKFSWKKDGDGNGLPFIGTTEKAQTNEPKEAKPKRTRKKPEPAGGGQEPEPQS